MNVAIFGATGMVGAGALLECLDDPGVTHVLAVGRRPAGRRHAKLDELVLDDLFDLSAQRHRLAGLDACLWCLGVSAAGMSEAEYTRLTYDLTLAAARTLLEANPGLSFCYVSGLGTDSAGSGRAMWARVKGRTERGLLAMPFGAAAMFRPGLIVPRRGVRSRTPLYRLVYTALGWALPLLRRLTPRQVTTTEVLGRAMIRAARGEAPVPVLEPPDIEALGGRRG